MGGLRQRARPQRQRLQYLVIDSKHLSQLRNYQLQLKELELELDSAVETEIDACVIGLLRCSC